MKKYPRTLYGNGAYTVVRDQYQELEAKLKGFIDPLEDEPFTTNENISVQFETVNSGSTNQEIRRRSRRRRDAE